MPLMPLRNHRLSWEQRKTLHDRLLQRAAMLRADVKEALHAQDPARLGLADPRETTDDEAVGDLQASLEVAAVQRDALELREIDEALQRLDAANFGSCVDCGAPIAWDRLLAVPQVERCTRCQTAAEKRGPVPARL
jgi:DnaK suppressor protein